MGVLSVHYLDDDCTDPVIYSMPAHSDPDGYVHEAKITIQPWGQAVRRQGEPGDEPVPIRRPEKCSISLNFSIDEAEALARRLVEVDVAAREGRYSEEGVQLVDEIEKSRLDDAWEALGLSRPEDG
jgi:hypothetical protein